MSRALTVKNIFDKKHKTFEFEGIWLKVLKKPSRSGVWLIYGSEKNGKTWLALQLAKYLSTITNVVYVSAEEGTESEFVETCKRAKINISDKHLKFFEYITLEELQKKLKNKKDNIFFIDNLTIYEGELKKKDLIKLIEDYPEKLFILLAHEERNEVYTTVGKLAKRLAKVIIYVKGLTGNVTLRGAVGGVLTIDENKAKLFYGNDVSEQ